jgi:hypothetical protein
MTDPEIKILWLYCQEAWGSTFTIPADEHRREIKLQFWRDVLEDLDANLVRRAVASSDAHFALTPQELRKVAIEIGNAEAGVGGAKDHDEALGELYRLISVYGYVRPDEAIAAAEEFSPILAATIRSMGWAEICADEDPGVFRGQFRKLYESASMRIDRTSRPLAPILAAALETAQIGRAES